MLLLLSSVDLVYVSYSSAMLAEKTHADRKPVFRKVSIYTGHTAKYMTIYTQYNGIQYRNSLNEPHGFSTTIRFNVCRRTNERWNKTKRSTAIHGRTVCRIRGCVCVHAYAYAVACGPAILTYTCMEGHKLRVYCLYALFVERRTYAEVRLYRCIQSGSACVRSYISV